MSQPFKLGLITAAIVAVLAVVIDVATGSRSVLAEVGVGLIFFAVAFLISFIIFRIAGAGKKKDDEYEYED